MLHFDMLLNVISYSGSATESILFILKLSKITEINSEIAIFPLEVSKRMEGEEWDRTPAQSPDQSPIENIWNLLKSELHQPALYV